MKAVKPMPSLPSDAAAEDFVSTANLADYDLTRFRTMSFELEPKSAALNMRLPESLLAALKAKAREAGIPYTRYVRMILERAIS